MKKYFGLLAVFLVAALLYQMSFAKTMNKLNNQKKDSLIEQSEAYGVVRSFITLANKKEQVELEKHVTNRGLDLGFDILLNPDIKLVEVVGVPHVSEHEISSLVLAFDQVQNKFSHYVLFFIKDQDDWYLYGLFRQKEQHD